MRMALYIILALVGLLLFVAGVLGVWGSMLPATHTASVSVVVNKPREDVWRLINDVESLPQWMEQITEVELLPSGPKGERTFRQSMGRNSFVPTETTVDPGVRVLRTIVDDNGPFTGRWDHMFEATSQTSTTVTITEHGTVKSAIPRAMTKLLCGYDYFLKIAAKQLKAKCG
jgi:uncharacterized protein YndB with AHSA1/START domain